MALIVAHPDRRKKLRPFDRRDFVQALVYGGFEFNRDITETIALTSLADIWAETEDREFHSMSEILETSRIPQ